MANIVVELTGTKKIYRYEKGGNKFLRTEPIYERKVFVTTLDGTCLIDGASVSADYGNDVYKKMISQVGCREYDSHCGRHTFLNIDDISVKTTKIDTKEYAMELASKYESSIDPYVDYIDNGAQYESAKAHNARLGRMVNALREIAETL